MKYKSPFTKIINIESREDAINVCINFCNYCTKSDSNKYQCTWNDAQHCYHTKQMILRDFPADDLKSISKFDYLPDQTRIKYVVPYSDGFYILIIKSSFIDENPVVKDFMIELANTINKIIPHKINDEIISITLRVRNFDNPDNFTIITNFIVNDKAICCNSMSCVLSLISDSSFRKEHIRIYCQNVYYESLLILINYIKTGKIDLKSYQHLINLNDSEDNNEEE